MKHKKRKSLFVENFCRSFKTCRYLRWWLYVLISLYLLAIFANFLAPYTAQYENRKFSYAPPSSIHFFDAEGKFSFRPFIYSREFEFNEFHERIYTEDITKKHYLELFSTGEETYILGLIPTTLHLFGTSSDEPFYLFGSDSRGRDIFSRTLYGSRISLTVGILGSLITFLIGTFIGCVAGYFGGRLDNILMRICEVILLIPSIYLLFALRALFPLTMSSAQMYFAIILILSLIGWAGLARVIRGMVLSLKEKEFILASQVLGQHPTKIIVSHIIPNMSSYLLVTILFSIPSYILGESTLSFLGLGIQDPSVSWGYLLKEASTLSNISNHPWVLIPSLFLILTISSFNVLGDFLRDLLDPQYQKL